MKYTLHLVSLLFSFLAIVSCENEEKDLPESVIYSDSDGYYEIEVDSTETIAPKITYDYNSTYLWTLDGEYYSSDNEITLTPDDLVKYNFVFSITNDRGSDTMVYTVQSMYNSTFEELTLSEDDTFSIASDYDGYFVSNKLKFEFEGEPNTGYADFQGFAYSDLTGSHSLKLDKIYSAYQAPDDDEYDSEIFIVMHQNSDLSPVSINTVDGKEHIFGSMKVNNTYYNYTTIKNGDDNISAKEFGGDTGKDEDYFILTINGYNLSNELTGTVDFYLADYTAYSNRDDYVIKEWTNVDLSSIEACSRLELSLSSSDTENDTMRTPAYVCLDEIKIIQ